MNRERLDGSELHTLGNSLGAPVRVTHASATRLLRWTLVAVLSFIATPLVHAAKPAPPPPPPPPPPPAGDACVGKGGVFPAMAYTRSIWDTKTGKFLKKRLFVANSLGNCEVAVYESTSTGANLEASFHFDFASGWGTLAWWQSREDGEGEPRRGELSRPLIKVARFQVISGNVMAPLPLNAVTVHRFYPIANFGIIDVELSQEGTRLGFSTEEGSFNGTGWVTDEWLVCNVANCAATLDVVFTTTNTLASGQAGGTHQLTLGRNGAGQERMYFIYRPSASFSDGDLVAIDNLGDGQWSAPQILVNRDVRYMGSIGDSDTSLDDPSALSQPNEADRVLIGSSPTSTGGPWRVDVYDTGTDTLTYFVGTGVKPSWTLYPTRDEHAPNVVANASNPSQSGAAIQEIDLDSLTQGAIGNAIGNYVDSAH